MEKGLEEGMSYYRKKESKASSTRINGGNIAELINVSKQKLYASKLASSSYECGLSPAFNARAHGGVFVLQPFLSIFL